MSTAQTSSSATSLVPLELKGSNPTRSKADIKLAEERLKKERRAQQLEALKLLNKERDERRTIEQQIRRERYAALARAGTATVKEAQKYGKALSPYAKSAASELSTGAKKVLGYAGGYLKNVANARSTQPQRMILTPYGRRVLDSFLRGDYRVIPPDSIRSQLLLQARGTGYFTLGEAIGAFGDNGMAAAQLLAEQGLIQRLS